jgi:hypothetical protein
MIDPEISLPLSNIEVRTQTFNVRIPDEILSASEKIQRIGSIQGTSHYHSAFLDTTSTAIELFYRDDYGRAHVLRTMRLDEITHVRVKRGAVTPARQILKPAITGFLVGAGFTSLMWFRIGEKRAVSIEEALTACGVFILLVSALFVLMNIEKIIWTPLAVVTFESIGHQTIRVAVREDEVAALLTPLSQGTVHMEHS